MLLIYWELQKTVSKHLLHLMPHCERSNTVSQELLDKVLPARKGSRGLTWGVLVNESALGIREMLNQVRIEGSTSQDSMCLEFHIGIVQEPGKMLIS